MNCPYLMWGVRASVSILNRLHVQLTSVRNHEGLACDAVSSHKSWAFDYLIPPLSDRTLHDGELDPTDPLTPQ